MKLTLTKGWFIRRVALEGNLDIAAGLPAHHPVLNQQGVGASASESATLPRCKSRLSPRAAVDAQARGDNLLERIGTAGFQLAGRPTASNPIAFQRARRIVHKDADEKHDRSHHDDAGRPRIAQARKGLADAWLPPSQHDQCETVRTQ